MCKVFLNKGLKKILSMKIKVLGPFKGNDKVSFNIKQLKLPSVALGRHIKHVFSESFQRANKDPKLFMIQHLCFNQVQKLQIHGEALPLPDEGKSATFLSSLHMLRL